MSCPARKTHPEPGSILLSLKRLALVLRGRAASRAIASTPRSTERQRRLDGAPPSVGRSLQRFDDSQLAGAHPAVSRQATHAAARPFCRVPSSRSTAKSNSLNAKAQRARRAQRCRCAKRPTGARDPKELRGTAVVIAVPLISRCSDAPRRSYGGIFSPCAFGGVQCVARVRTHHTQFPSSSSFAAFAPFAPLRHAVQDRSACRTEVRRTDRGAAAPSGRPRRSARPRWTRSCPRACRGCGAATSSGRRRRRRGRGRWRP